MSIIGTLLTTAKTFLGKKSTQDILKYLSVVALNYARNKYNINQYKYDPLDMKNMVYHHNMNYNNQINKNEVDKAINLFAIERLIREMNEEGDTNGFISELAKTCGDMGLMEIYDRNNTTNQILSRFDNDTLETSSIADNYEISSGGIYVPDRNIITYTEEGEFLANAKNDYLEARQQLGMDGSNENVNKLIKEYYDKINHNFVLDYFNM